MKNKKRNNPESLLQKFVILWIVSILSVNCLFAQSSSVEEGIPFIRNYTDKEYSAAQQNWAIEQDRNGMMYFGNNTGLLAYNGKTWAIVELKNNSIVRSLGKDTKGLIYAGGVSEFGFFKPNKQGSFTYNSLSDKLKEEEKEFEDVWKIHVIDDVVYFQSFKRLFRYKDGNLKSWKANGSFHLSFVVNKQLYIIQKEKGILKLNEDKLEFCRGTSVFADKKVTAILPFYGKLLIATMSNGLYIAESTKAPDSMLVNEFDTRVSDELKEASVYQGLFINNKLIFATLNNGVFIVSEKGELIRKYNKSNGLPDDKIWAVKVIGKHLWLATNKGISKVDFNSPVSKFDERNGLQGKIYSIKRINDQIFAAGSVGLFFLNSEGRFDQVPGLNLQFWDILDINKDKFLAASTAGILLIGRSGDGFDYEQLTERQCFSLSTSLNNSDIIYASCSDGVQVLNVSDVNKISIEDMGTLDVEVRNTKDDKDGNIWVATGYNGVYKVKKGSGGYLHDTLPGLPEKIGNLLEYIDGRIIITTPVGVYQYVKEKNKFEFDSILHNKFFRKRYQIFRLAENANHEVFMQINYKIGDSYKVGPLAIARKFEDKYFLDTLIFKEVPRTLTYALYSDKSGLWIGNGDGIYHYNNVQSTLKENFNVLIDQVFVFKDTLINGKKERSVHQIFWGYFSEVNNGEISISSIQKEAMIPEIEYGQNSITIYFAAPYFDNEESIVFQCKLEGYDDAWSGWSPVNFKEYPKLPPGKYSFKVKAKNLYGSESEVMNYSFVILPPWYRTTWAYIIYVILGIGAIYGIVQISIYRLKRAKEKLEEIVKERTAEIVKQKDEIENKNEELNQQNEEILAQRDEIEKQKHLLEDKNKEITDSIYYAKRIQEAILVDTTVITKNIPDSFILFKPKDIVSGDFYFYKKIELENGLHALAAADCTGHGVPGAFMSMIGNDKLNEAVKELSDPGQVLSHLNKLIKQSLQKEENASSAKDGMDIALCLIDTTNRKVLYAGANRPLWILRNNHVLVSSDSDANDLSGFQEIKATKTAIGGFTEYDQQYETHQMEFAAGDTVYFFSDGYADQFGGPSGKKMMTKKFRDKLIELKGRPMKEQKEILDEFYENWKTGYEQVDDVLVIGVRF